MFAFAEPLDWLVRGLVLTALAVLWTLLLVRIVGLRAFSKMTAFDFVTTIATGSLIAQAGTRPDWTSFLQALAAMLGVFAIQWILAVARKSSPVVRKLIRNNPVLLMENGRFIGEAMTQTRTSRANVLEKIRQANVSSLEGVSAVVLETTGDISVLTGKSIDPALLEGVGGARATSREVQPSA